MIWKNDTQNQLLEEEVTFELKGLKIEGLAPGVETIISMSVGPGEHHVVKMTAIEPEFEFAIGNSYNVVDCGF